MAEDLSDIFVSTEPTLLTTGWGRTEGPLWHPDGSVTFVDMEASRLLRWDPSGSVTVVRENTGEGNGCTLDRQGRLIMCEGADPPAHHPDGSRRQRHGHRRALARQTLQ